LKDHKNDIEKEIDESKTEIQKMKEEDENIKKQLKEKDEDIKRQFKEQKEDLQKEIDESKTEIQEEIENQKGELQKEIKDGDTNLKEHFNPKIHGINKELAYLESLEIKSINGTLNDHMTEFFLFKAQFKEITDKINANLGHLESANRELLNESEARGKELLSQEKSYLQAEMATKLNQVRHRLYRQRESLLQDIEAGDKRIQALDQLQNEMTAKINGLDNKFSNLDSSLCQMGTVGCVDNCGGKGGPSMYSTLYEESVVFAKTFSKKPDVVLAMNEIDQTSEHFLADQYGWKMYPTAISPSGFQANIEMLDRQMDTFKAIWIACY